MVLVSGTNADNLLDLSNVRRCVWRNLGGIQMIDFDISDLTDEFLVTKKFRDSNEFSLFIEEQTRLHKISYMEAVISYCDENDIEPESIKKLINQQLRDRIRHDAEEEGLMVKCTQLEF